jgi:hypothetical protein
LHQKLVELRDRHEVKSSKPLQDEGSIKPRTTTARFNDRTASPERLPDLPSKFWPGVGKGTSKTETEKALLAFIDEVYGPYMLNFRDSLRNYIFRKDRKLYRAINHYEKSDKPLPEKLRMPSRGQRVAARIERIAKQGNLQGLDEQERRSALGKLRRDDKPTLKH